MVFNGVTLEQSKFILFNFLLLIYLKPRYVDMHTDYTGQGVDQLQNVIDTIKKDPNNRRIVMSAWNPSGFFF